MKKNPSSSPINSRPSHTTWTHWERRKSRQHRASAQPSPPQFLHNTKRRRSSPLDVTRLWSDKTDPPPSLPPSWGCLAATQEAAPVLTAELARSSKGGNSTFPDGGRPCPRELHQGCHQSWARCLGWGSGLQKEGSRNDFQSPSELLLN